MPEIAEVRVVANTLKKKIINKKIEKIKIFYTNIIENDRHEFEDILVNKTFKDITTYGKWIMFNLGEYTLLSHLRMEGKYYYENSSNEIEKHTHIIFKLNDGYDLRYNDTRKFGKMLVVKTNEVFNTPCIKKLGLEPDNKYLTKEYLYEKINKSNKTIKELLLDQTIINGLGNIYANEVLFTSKINPTRKGSQITFEECETIINNAKKIIIDSYNKGGCTIRSYTSSLGVIGHYQDDLKVHNRAYKPCKKCNTLIKIMKIGERSTYYCPNCQKK